MPPMNKLQLGDPEELLARLKIHRCELQKLVDIKQGRNLAMGLGRWFSDIKDYSHRECATPPSPTPSSSSSKDSEDEVCRESDLDGDWQWVEVEKENEIADLTDKSQETDTFSSAGKPTDRTRKVLPRSHTDSDQQTLPDIIIPAAENREEPIRYTSPTEPGSMSRVTSSPSTDSSDIPSDAQYQLAIKNMFGDDLTPSQKAECDVHLARIWRRYFEHLESNHKLQNIVLEWEWATSVINDRFSPGTSAAAEKGMNRTERTLSLPRLLLEGHAGLVRGRKT